MSRDLRPSSDLVARGTGFYTIEEPLGNVSFPRTTCIFLTPGDREDFIALVEYTERLAPKGCRVQFYLEDDGRRVWEIASADEAGSVVSFHSFKFLDAVRIARAHFEGDPELLP